MRISPSPELSSLLRREDRRAVIAAASEGISTDGKAEEPHFCAHDWLLDVRLTSRPAFVFASCSVRCDIVGYFYAIRNCKLTENGKKRKANKVANVFKLRSDASFLPKICMFIQKTGIRHSDSTWTN